MILGTRVPDHNQHTLRIFVCTKINHVMTLELFQEDPYRKQCFARVNFVNAALKCFGVNQTVFYPTGGEQPGDIGFAHYVEDSSRSIEVIDTRRDRTTGEIQHFVAVDSLLPAVGDELLLSLDWQRRYQLMRMHSCLHLLCAIIPSRVTGCQVYVGRGRVDFDVSEPLDKDQISYRLKLLIEENANRKNLVVTPAELKSNTELANSLSVPAPKNVDRINLVHFEGIDLQPCGGTHVANTNEIGHARIQKIANKGKHNRRITVTFE